MANLENTIVLSQPSPAKAHPKQEQEKDLKNQDPLFGGNHYESSSNADQAMSLLRMLRGLSPEDYETVLPNSEWQDIKQTIRSCYRQRNSVRYTEETESLLLPTPTALSRAAGAKYNPPGQDKLEGKLKDLLSIPQGFNSHPEIREWLMGFPLGWTDCTVEEPGINLLMEQQYVSSTNCPTDSTEYQPSEIRLHLSKQRSPFAESSISSSGDSKAKQGGLGGLPHEPLLQETFGNLDTLQKITQSNSERLIDLELTIKNEIRELYSFEKVGRALLTIQAESLYKEAGYTNFVTYCYEKFNLKKTRIYQLISAIKVIDNCQSVIDFDKIELCEEHCLELSKIKDLNLQKQVLAEIVSSQIPLTGTEIVRTKQMFDSQEIKDSILLPEIGSIVRITGRIDPKQFNYKGYWGVVVFCGEFSCDVRVLNKELTAVHPQYLLKLPTLGITEYEFALGLLDRLDDIYRCQLANDTTRIIVEAIATRPIPCLDTVDEAILSALEKFLHL